MKKKEEEKKEKQNKGIQIEKEEVKLSLFSADTILYIKILRKQTKNTIRSNKQIQQGNKFIRKKIHL